MSDASDETRKPKVVVRVSAPHVPPRAEGAPPSALDEGGERDRKARKGALFLCAVVGLYVVFLVVSGQMATFLAALSSVDVGWVLKAAGCYCLYFALGVLAYVIAVYLDHDSPVGVRDLVSVEASGIFFGNLTPMMAGAVPSQIFRLTRTGLDVGEASATEFTRFIMFQLGVVLFAALMLVARLSYFFATFGDIIILNLVVFGVHFLELAGLFFVCLCPGFVSRVGGRVIDALDRRGWLKDRAHWDEVVNVQVREFSSAFMRAARDVPDMLLTLLVTMLQLAFLYMIPWFVLRAFGQDADFIDCLASASMVQMVASAVPLPGGTGGAEGGFVMFYGIHFGAATTAGFLIWRIVTFFGPTLIAAPLMSLRSQAGGPSIYRRVQRLRQRLAALASRRRRDHGAVVLGGSKLKGRLPRQKSPERMPDGAERGPR
ncbi:lysylphosphatidylglycerol synthase transmembrane domain-containing protein [Olsenella sp. HMSC062G07]|uniref:lysylphosphatidylglycerol synthase transmembrane domain-containing protein n=1 Tax=Olsenella sp. HMSC062G07 TaxID=1739330 RepID=UPI0008A23C2E|nr:lysylphosphatidylglycerol synthase transmembrane domain-containing protein [Olsenella sp. HMSC062G07]OFK24576.1 hypothetical protein HMPREF2826_06665 [Olsenella sp. HMSC062G07]